MTTQIIRIPTDQILASPYQGRLISSEYSFRMVNDGELLKLVESIKVNGQLNPVIVRKSGEKYEMIDGHRRFEAHRLLNRKQISAIVRDMTDREAQVMSVVSNMQRKDLHNIERAFAFKKILDSGVFKDKRELSKAINKDETYVGDLLQTLNMDKRIVEDLLENKTTNDVRTLRAIRKVEQTDENDISDKQWEIYMKFKHQNLSREEVFNLSRIARNERQKGLLINFTPRRIEINLPKKYNKSQRELLLKILEEKIMEILPDIKDS